MDARRFALFALPLALTACSSLSTPPNPGLAVFEQSIGQAANRDSIVRRDDRVNYLVAPGPAAPAVTRFSASCSQTLGSMRYETDKGMKAFSSSPGSDQLPPAQLQALQHSQQLRQACAYRPVPDWRALDLSEGQDWLLLDRKSVVHEEGLLKIWTGTLLARSQAAPLHRLIAQKQERLAIDCAQHRFMRLSQVSVDSDGLISSLSVERQPALAPFAQADAGQLRLLETACQSAEAWAALPAPPARKARAPHLQTPTTAPAVLAAIHALNLPQPRLKLEALEYSYDMSLLNRLKLTDLKREDAFSTDPQSGQMLVQSYDPVQGTQLQLTFRGLVELTKNSIDIEGKEVADPLPIIEASFSGDWAKLPEGEKVLYTTTYASKGKTITSVSSCRIAAAQPAREIHPDLQGMTKLLTCESIAATLKAIYRYHYLEDYGLFINDSMQSVLSQGAWRVHSVR